MENHTERSGGARGSSHLPAQSRADSLCDGALLRAAGGELELASRLVRAAASGVERGFSPLTLTATVGDGSFTEAAAAGLSTRELVRLLFP